MSYIFSLLNITDLNYRSRTEIVASILEAANGGVTKTKIMYKAFLSFDQLKEYLEVLSNNGLLDYEPNSRLFRTTAKGFQFLTLISQMDQIVYGQKEKELAQRGR